MKPATIELDVVAPGEQLADDAIDALARLLIAAAEAEETREREPPN